MNSALVSGNLWLDLYPLIAAAAVIAMFVLALARAEAYNSRLRGLIEEMADVDPRQIPAKDRSLIHRCRAEVDQMNRVAAE